MNYPEHVQDAIFELHARFCRALAHPVRLKAIDALRQGEKSAGELQAYVGTSKANLSQHLATLRQQRIVYARREGVHLYYRLAHPRLVELCDTVQELLAAQLAEDERLSQALQQEHAKPQTSPEH